jgi:pyruvyl transferase EpsO
MQRNAVRGPERPGAEAVGSETGWRRGRSIPPGPTGANDPRHATIARLQNEIDGALGAELDGVRSFALVDFPDHANVGDSAIYLGELAWLHRRYGLRPGYVCTVDNFAPAALRQAVPDGPILIHGGGNFGDIWPGHQRLREAVLAAFPGRRIVQLPQTIHFANPAARDRVAAGIAAHGNVLLLARDAVSLDLARRSFDCEARLCPDMAFALGAQDRSAPARHELLLLLRTDHERRPRDPCVSVPAGGVAADWLDEPPDLHARLRRRTALWAALAKPAAAFDRCHQRERLYRALAARRVARGLGQLGSARSVITDRLHGHILCLLLGIPHIVFDNHYGKLGGFIDTWTAACGLAQVTDSLAAALACWRGKPASVDRAGIGRAGVQPARPAAVG